MQEVVPEQLPSDWQEYPLGQPQAPTFPQLSAQLYASSQVHEVPPLQLPSDWHA